MVTITSHGRSQFLITKNDNGKSRMVMDYSQKINKFSLMDVCYLTNINKLVSNIAQPTFHSTIDL